MPTISRLRLLVPCLALVSTAALVAHGAPLQTSGNPSAEADKAQLVKKIEAAAQAKATPAPRKVISKVNPVYPPALKEKKISGVVQLVVVVDPSGAPTSVTARPDDNPDLAKAAIEAVRQWRWEPGKGDIKMTHTIDFRLDTAKKE